MSSERIPLPFHRAAPEALGDAQLRRNLAGVTSTIRTKRDAVTGELPDWQELRRAAKAVKDHTLRNLGVYLEKLEDRVTAAGGPVLPARVETLANQGVQEFDLTAREGETIIVENIYH